VAAGERDGAAVSASEVHGGGTQGGWRGRLGRWSPLAAALRGACPACAQRGIFAGWYRLNERCSSCGAVFERDPGSFLGATVLAYIWAMLAMGVVALLSIPGRGLYPGLEGVLLLTAVATVLLSYRPTKALWLWMMWVAGWVHPTGVDPEQGSG